MPVLDLPVIGFPVYHALSSAVLGLFGGAATPSGCLRVMPERWFRDMAIRVTTRNRLETCPILSGEAANRRTGLSWSFVWVRTLADSRGLPGRCSLHLPDVRSAYLHWRERPVPAAAVIPAPMAYLPIVAVEALVATVTTARLRAVRDPSCFGGCGPLVSDPEECHVQAPDRCVCSLQWGKTATRMLGFGLLPADCGL